MHVAYKGSRVVVLDEVLPPAQASAVWHWFQAQPLGVSAPGDHSRRLSDGFVYAGSATVMDVSRPSDALVEQTLLEAAGMAEDLIGAPGDDWRAITRTCWAYPSGSQLGWHNDGGDTQTGAFVWYVHPRWNASWGGELLVVDERASTLVRSALDAGLVRREQVEWSLDTDVESDVLFTGPDPLCVQARPNRVVILAGDTFHTVRRVDSSAGDHPRCSLAGFFLKTANPAM